MAQHNRLARNAFRVLLMLGLHVALISSSSTVASVPADSTRVANPAKSDTQFGIAYGETLSHMSSNKLDNTLDDAVATHVRWIRADLSWATVQPSGRNDFRWDRFDRVVQAAHARGLQVLPILTYTPAWAREPGCQSFACPPADPRDFARFAEHAAKRYSSLDVHTWEIWNEPNWPMFWVDPDPKRYANLLHRTVTALRTSDEHAIAVMGGLAATYNEADGSIDPRNFLDAVCATGACHSVEAVGYHPYTYPYPASYTAPWGTSWDRISTTHYSLRSVLERHGLGGKPIWVTEYGAPTNGPGKVSTGPGARITVGADHVTEGYQAIIASDAVATAAASPDVAALFWYSYQDDTYYTDNVAHYGLRRSDGSMKPAWRAFSSAVAAASQ